MLKKENGVNVQYQTEIISIKDETPDVKTFRLKRPEGFNFISGQYSLLGIDDSETRPFTFSSSPLEKEFLEITAKKMGNFTSQMFSLKAGDKLFLSQPKGQILNYIENKKSVFIAGGSGITPFISAIRYSIDTHSTKEITLFFSNKSKEDIIYYNELEKISKEYPNIKIINTITDKIPDDWKQESGRINLEMIKKYVEVPDDYIWYVCGPPPMVLAVEKILEEFKMNKENIKIEQWQMPGKN